MKKLLALVTSTLLYAANPAIYSQLGDPLYNDVDGVQTLGKQDILAELKGRAEGYVKEAERLKAEGLAIDRCDSGAMAHKDYLKALRKLDKEHAFFVRKADEAMLMAIDGDKYATFAALVNSGMVDVDAHEEKVLNYYASKRGSVAPIQELEAFLAYKEAQRKRAAANKADRKERYQAYREYKIDRFRKRDKADQEAFEKELEAEVDATKAEVDSMLKQELRTR